MRTATEIREAATALKVLERCLSKIEAERYRLSVALQVVKQLQSKLGT